MVPAQTPPGPQFRPRQARCGCPNHDMPGRRQVPLAPGQVGMAERPRRHLVQRLPWPRAGGDGRRHASSRSRRAPRRTHTRAGRTRASLSVCPDRKAHPRPVQDEPAALCVPGYFFGCTRETTWHSSYPPVPIRSDSARPDNVEGRLHPHQPAVAVAADRFPSQVRQAPWFRQCLL